MPKRDIAAVVQAQQGKRMRAPCGGCEYLSKDFNKCIRCSRKLPKNVKAVVNWRAKKGHRRGGAGPTRQKQGCLGQAHGAQSVAEPLPAVEPPETPSPELVKEGPKAGNECPLRWLCIFKQRF